MTGADPPAYRHELQGVSMRIAVLSETDPVETRVAATPDMVKKYKNLGADVVVQAGAGGQASIADAEFESAGATIAQNAGDAVKDADIVLKVRRPAECGRLLQGAILRGRDQEHGDQEAQEHPAVTAVEAGQERNVAMVGGGGVRRAAFQDSIGVGQEQGLDGGQPLLRRFVAATSQHCVAQQRDQTASVLKLLELVDRQRLL